MRIFDEIKRLTPGELERGGIIKEARKRANGYPTYICPVCGNGSGKVGDGLVVYENGEFYKFHCFGQCSKQYSAVDLIGEYIGANAETKEGKNKVAEYAKEKFHLEGDTISKADNREKPKTKYEPKEKTEGEKPKETKKIELIQSIIERSRKNLHAFIEENGGKWRGLTLETLEKYGVGYEPKFVSPDNVMSGKKVEADARMIIPVELTTFLARAIEKTEKYEKVHAGQKKLFGVLNEEEFKGSELIFACEGYIDAMSIEQVSEGLYNIVAVGGANELAKLPQWFDEYFKDLTRKPVIGIIADNDGPGITKAENAAKNLISAGYPTKMFVLSEVEKYDANEYLQADEGDKLLTRISDISDELKESEPELRRAVENESERQKESPGVRIGNYFLSEFDAEMAGMKEYAGRKSGFENLDKEQRFLPGLYVIGGKPGTGKTTFMWQLLEQMARMNETAIFCSYEMSQMELFTKTLAREIKKASESKAKSSSFLGKIANNLECLTATDIQSGLIPERWRELYETAKSEIIQAKLDLRVLELHEQGIDELIKQFDKIRTECEKSPIFCIDYLQIIPSDKDTSKRGIDEIARKLKDFQRRTNSTLFVISSINRESYRPVGDNTADLKSFKESGNIEYSADVLWSLTLDGKGEGGKDERELLKSPIRKVKLNCSKNRRGAIYEVGFEYFAAADWFKPVAKEEEDKNIPDIG